MLSGMVQCWLTWHFLLVCNQPWRFLQLLLMHYKGSQSRKGLKEFPTTGWFHFSSRFIGKSQLSERNFNLYISSIGVPLSQLSLRDLLHAYHFWGLNLTLWFSNSFRWASVLKGCYFKKVYKEAKCYLQSLTGLLQHAA